MTHSNPSPNLKPNPALAAPAMPFPLVLVLGLVLSSPLPGQGDQAGLAAKRDRKLASAFLEKADWSTDYDAARAAARRSGKVIFAYFTCSYEANERCERLESGPLSSGAFEKFAGGVVLLCHVTSLVTTDPYQELMREKGGQVFPYVAFLDDRGDVVARQSYGELDVTGFARTLAEKVKGYFDLRTKAASGDPAARAEFFMRRVELDHLDVAALEEALGQDFLSAAQKQRIREKVAEVKLEELLAESDLDDPKALGPIAATILRINRDVGIPPGSVGLQAWMIVLEDAFVREDVKVFELAFTALKAGGMSIRPDFVEQQARRLAELEKKAAKRKAEQEGGEQGGKGTDEKGQKEKKGAKEREGGN